METKTYPVPHISTIRQYVHAEKHNVTNFAKRQERRRREIQRLDQRVRPLSNDVARCAGVGSDTDGWRDGCEDCLRRTDPGSGQWVTHMSAPSIIMFECEYRIEAAMLRGELGDA